MNFVGIDGFYCVQGEAGTTCEVQYQDREGQAAMVLLTRVAVRPEGDEE